MSASILEVNNLSIEFFTKRGWVRAVNNLSFDVKDGEILGIVGESGCGKSVTSLAILGLLPARTSRITNGEIIYNENNLLKLSETELRGIRGQEISMVFQDSMTSLNPVMSIGKQMVNCIRAHRSLSNKVALEEAIGLLDLVEISAPDKRIKEYPHQLSGGMRQRVMIAMALINSPKLLIADEPTTALDVTVQAQILSLLKKLQLEKKMSIILITHDMGVVSEMADRVMVMYAGEKIEIGTRDDIFEACAHPYSQGLLNSIPSFSEQKDELFSIKGRVPSLHEMPPYCRFFERCDESLPRCQEINPPVIHITNTHAVKCWKFNNL